MVYQALHLLCGRHARDEIRYGFALYTAARICNSHELRQFAVAAKMAADAEQTFRAQAHAFANRALILRARSLLKARGPDAALVALERLELESISDSPERRYAEGLLHLTKAWVFEHQESWQQCLEEAEKISTNPSLLPRSLIAEGHLHRGIARVRLGSRSAGLAEIEQAIEIARDHKRVKIELAGMLALSEFLYSELPQEALRYWLQARQKATGVCSAFLWDWIRRLSPLFRSPVPVPMDQKFDQAYQQFVRLYLDYHGQRSGGDTGLSLSRYYRLRKKAEKGTAGRREATPQRRGVNPPRA